jgi:hypothetical protein
MSHTVFTGWIRCNPCVLVSEISLFPGISRLSLALGERTGDRGYQGVVIAKPDQ